MMIRNTFLAATAAVVVGASADAATVAAFDLRASDNSQPNLTSTTLQDGGITLEATATGGAIRQTVFGFGVAGEPEGPYIGLGESLFFTLASGGVFSSASIVAYERLAEPESFAVVAGGREAIFTLPAGNGASSMSFDISAVVKGTSSFEIRGLEGSSDPDDLNRRGFLLAEIEVAAVPLPPAVLGSAIGLMALGLVGRRKRRAANAA